MQDAASLTGSDEFDFIATFDAVHDQAKPRDMVEESSAADQMVTGCALTYVHQATLGKI